MKFWINQNFPSFYKICGILCRLWVGWSKGEYLRSFELVSKLLGALLNLDKNIAQCAPNPFPPFLSLGTFCWNQLRRIETSFNSPQESQRKAFKDSKGERGFQISSLPLGTSLPLKTIPKYHRICESRGKFRLAVQCTSPVLPAFSYTPE